VTKQIEKMQAKEIEMKKKLKQHMEDFKLVREIHTGEKPELDETEVMLS